MPVGLLALHHSTESGAALQKVTALVL